MRTPKALTEEDCRPLLFIVENVDGYHWRSTMPSVFKERHILTKSSNQIQRSLLKIAIGQNDFDHKPFIGKVRSSGFASKVLVAPKVGFLPQKSFGLSFHSLITIDEPHF